MFFAVNLLLSLFAVTLAGTLQVKFDTALQHQDCYEMRRLLEHSLPSEVDPSTSQSLALDVACSLGQTRLVSLLLKDPRIDPLQRYSRAFTLAVGYGNFPVVMLLLKDGRVPVSILYDFKSVYLTSDLAWFVQVMPIEALEASSSGDHLELSQLDLSKLDDSHFEILLTRSKGNRSVRFVILRSLCRCWASVPISNDELLFLASLKTCSVRNLQAALKRSRVLLASLECIPIEHRLSVAAAEQDMYPQDEEIHSAISVPSETRQNLYDWNVYIIAPYILAGAMLLFRSTKNSNHVDYLIGFTIYPAVAMNFLHHFFLVRRPSFEKNLLIVGLHKIFMFIWARI